MIKKFSIYFISFLFVLCLMLFCTYLYVYFEKGVLFFDAFVIAFLCSLVGFFIYRKFYKEGFEGFLVFCTYFFLSSMFVYLGPVTLDRSLSSFIFMYSVEKGEITTDIFDKDYFYTYIQRRFEDGEKIGFITCKDNICKPTIKSKLLFNTLYPIGKVSKKLDNYDEYREMLIKKTSN